MPILETIIYGGELLVLGSVHKIRIIGPVFFGGKSLASPWNCLRQLVWRTLKWVKVSVRQGILSALDVFVARSAP